MAAQTSAMSRSFARGLVVGKFCPLHRGHESVIRRALECCGEVFVLSYTSPELPGCEPDKRRAWLAARFPEVRSLVLEASDGIPPNDADDTTHRRFTARICRERFGTSVDAVFTSEAYGDGFAAELSREFSHPVSHVMVDAARDTIPISGTQLRADIHSNRRLLAPEVYASFVQRVTILGGESSGKTTLAAALAEHFGTVWVPEFGRELWVERGGNLQPEDLPFIAETQIAREEAACLRAHRFVFCDTSPLTTLFYCRDLFGSAPAELEAEARRPYDFTILCEPDFPFEQDGTRQDAAFRQRQHEWYLKQLDGPPEAFCIASGTLAERLAIVSRHAAFSRADESCGGPA
jgi:HTH-type transcriptional regulator, transcriptional repressor of NAD biosynthesis genes